MSDYEFKLDVANGPLDGNLFIDPGVRNILGNDFVGVVDDALRFAPRQGATVINAQGRNYYIPLSNPIGPYDVLQVAGGGNFDIGINTNAGIEDLIITPISTEDTRVVVPPSEGSGFFTGYATFYENGNCVVKESVDPMGSYTSRSARNKIDQTAEAFTKLTAARAGVIVPMYVGKFEYEVADQFGDPQTAILMLAPSHGRRFDSKLLSPLNVHLIGRGPSPGEEFASELKAFYQDSLMPRMSAIGSGIAIMHAAGMVHHQLTGGNTDALVSPDRILVPYITDWGTVTTPSEADKPGAQALDVAIAIESASAVAIRLSKLEAIDRATAVDLMLFTGFSMLKGYFGHQNVSKLERIDPFEIINVASRAADTDTKVQLVKAWMDS